MGFIKPYLSIPLYGIWWHVGVMDEDIDKLVFLFPYMGFIPRDLVAYIDVEGIIFLFPYMGFLLIHGDDP